MKLLKGYHLMAIVTLLSICSCLKEESNSIAEKEVQNEKNAGKPIVLGQELEIPYTTVNMQTAVNNLMSNLKSRSKNSKLAKTFKTDDEIEVVPSHYYYRFLPKDSLEHDLITNDTILQASNVPLHYEIEEEGDFYQDPELEADNPFQYLYAVVPYDYSIPENVQNEHLNDLYFAPEDNKDELQEGEIAVKQPLNKTTKDILTVDNSGEVFEYLELEALKLTNNLDEDELAVLQFYLPNDTTATLYSYTDANALGYEQKDLIIDLSSVDTLLQQEQLANRSSWNPSGTITVAEDAIGKNVGVVGAEVKVRKWGLVVIRRTRTNANGYFRTSSTKTKRVKYAVHFNNPGRFRVMAGSILVRAMHRGTRTYKRRSWNQYFPSGRGQFYALVHNAAYDYYTRVVPEYRLSRPRYCTISAKYNRDVSSEHRPAVNIIYSDIRVTRIQNGNYRGSDGIYATTVHELTHAGHREMDLDIFSILARSCRRDMLMESWAEGVETIVTNDRFKTLSPSYFNNSNDNIGWNYLRQRNRVFEMTEYTPIVSDLIDNYNQSAIYGGLDPNPPIDRVMGYTLEQIQRALDNCRTLDCWQNNLRNHYHNTSEQHLNELFDYARAVLNNNNPDRCD
ncbi:carboxypeptidase-like regulatory domain-containing protein [Flagellimonas sp.]|uniref:carboxypeptidase-like regulatory domain-containing protein n=1 Tax=Flagellimonas sp. TaxID=2058762 RepID=UPI003B50D042